MKLDDLMVAHQKADPSLRKERGTRDDNWLAGGVRA